jgi:tetratricopeptide (TPR) repeat protein
MIALSDKTKRLLIILLSITVLFITGKIHAQNGDGGTESNFHIGFGARAMGMGSAFTALADDATAVFWNPAGLENIYQQSVTLFYTKLIEGDYQFMGYAVPTLNLGTFGVGIGRIGVSGIEQTSETGRPLGSFDYGEYQAFLSYSKDILWNITAGTSVRILYRGWPGLQNLEGTSNADLNDFGVGADFGFLYKPEWFGNLFLQDWSFGLNIKNLFAPQMNEGDNIDEFPLTIKFGLLKKIRFAGSGSLNLLFDLDHSVNRDMRFHMGTEYSFQDIGMLRLGFNNSSLAFGAGLKYSMFQIDYGLGNSQATDAYSDVLQTMHRVSLTINFGLNRDELFAIAEEKRRREEERIITEIREADKQKFIAEHLQQADTYFKDDNYLDAIVEYQQVISADPFHFRAKVMLDSANTMLQQEFQEEQAEAVQEALDTERAESDRAFIEEHYERGRTYLDKKQFTEALMEFNIALSRDPNQQTVQEAIRTTQRRINEEINSLLQRSRREMQDENYSEALRLLSDARLLGGENPDVLRQIETLTQRIKLQDNIRRGLELYDLGKYNRALELFEEVLQADPENNLVRQYYQRSKI